MSHTPIVPTVGPVTHRDIRRDSVTLEWEPPHIPSNLETEVESYIIEHHDSTAWKPLARVPHSVTRYQVPDLAEGRRHKFRISMDTTLGRSAPVEYEPPSYVPPHRGVCDC